MKTEIIKLDNLGRGITYINNKICFVENALPNEIVKIKITSETKKYYEGVVEEYITTSNTRIEEECPYSKLCGGCQLNHLCFNEENKYKKEKVKEILKKYGNINPYIIKKIYYHERNNYRNKIILHGKDQQLGLYCKKSHEIIPIKSCLLVNPKINEMIPIINNYNKDIKEVMIKVSNDSSKVMVALEGEVTNISELVKRCDIFILNGKRYTKESRLLTNIGTKEYYQSSDSFFQINSTLTKDLYDEVLFHIKNNNYNKVLDLYCGTGTIGIYISNYVKNVIGIDYNRFNIEDANQNKKINNISNITFICDKVENKINEFTNIDCIIVDPPRAGLDDKTIKYLKIINPKKIIYVSCEPITLARDLKLIQDKYTIKSIKVFNMFPRTYHCESVCILERK